mgnify:FL=1|jgi:hypothetical protein|tara:strand:- start:179 stop:799 length:621 start_codon:yes stop_codon:yes gene_type:complete
MNITQIDNKPDLFFIKNLIPDELLDELSTINLMELSFSKLRGQEDWQRRTLAVEVNSVFDKITQFINSQRELISASIGLNIAYAGPNYWLDLKGMTVGTHIDNPNVNVVMQLYLSDCDNAGTNFYNVKDSEIEIRDDEQKWWYNNTTVEPPLRHTFECVKNTGYIMINDKTQLHGNPKMLLSKDDERLSLYCHLYTEQEFNKPKRN